MSKLETSSQKLTRELSAISRHNKTSATNTLREAIESISNTSKEHLNAALGSVYEEATFGLKHGPTSIDMAFADSARKRISYQPREVENSANINALHNKKRIDSQSKPTAIRNASDIGHLVRKARKAMQMNQSDFAAHAGVGRRFVSELESGKPSLEFDKVMACADVLGIEILARLRSGP